MRPKATKIAKYLITGGLSFAFEYGAFLLLVYVFSTKVWLAQAISYCLALVVNFLLLRCWTFRHQGKHAIAVQVPRYLILAAVNLLISTLLINSLNDRGVKPFLAKLIVVSVIAVWNYVVYDRIIFKQIENVA
jgi:putative flippase GtrA